MSAQDEKVLRQPWRVWEPADAIGSGPFHIYAGVRLIATLWHRGVADWMVQTHNRELEKGND